MGDDRGYCNAAVMRRSLTFDTPLGAMEAATEATGPCLWHVPGTIEAAAEATEGGLKLRPMGTMEACRRRYEAGPANRGCCNAAGMRRSLTFWHAPWGRWRLLPKRRGLALGTSPGR